MFRVEVRIFEAVMEGGLLRSGRGAVKRRGKKREDI